MKGLRTQESEKFNKFWEMVQHEAKKRNAVFFADCGEGNDFETDDMEGEDFCGWLIPEDQVEMFEPNWDKGNVSDKWVDKLIWVKWRKENNQIFVEFEK